MGDMTTQPLCVRPAEAARMIGVGKTRLYELIAAGELHPYKLGRATLIDVADIKALLDRQRGRAA
jgi:excisionase family DNA binding protein